MQINTHAAIIVFGLEVHAPNHINPNQTLLRSAIWEFSELTRWRSYTWVIWQGIHFERTLQVQE